MRQLNTRRASIVATALLGLALAAPAALADDRDRCDDRVRVSRDSSPRVIVIVTDRDHHARDRVSDRRSDHIRRHSSRAIAAPRDCLTQRGVSRTYRSHSRSAVRDVYSRHAGDRRHSNRDACSRSHGHTRHGYSQHRAGHNHRSIFLESNLRHRDTFLRSSNVHRGTFLRSNSLHRDIFLQSNGVRIIEHRPHSRVIHRRHASSSSHPCRRR